MFATDLAWWESTSGEKARSKFKGEMWTSSREVVDKYSFINLIARKQGVGVGSDFVYTGGGNSGFQAVNLALIMGAQEVILLGFTMKLVDGKTHWHRDHSKQNPTLNLLDRWAKALSQLAEHTDKVKIYGDSAATLPKTESIVPKCKGVIAVAKSGGWVTADYAQRLHRDTGALVLNDMDLPYGMSLEYDWQGWWAKMEVFRPDIKGDWLYIDMDTLVAGDIKPLLEFDRLGLLGDYYRPKLETGVMYLPEWARRIVWDKWIQSPRKWMKQYRGDGDFIREVIGEHAEDLRQHVDGLHSYKVHGKRDDTRLLIYHGSPRPHETEHW